MIRLPPDIEKRDIIQWLHGTVFMYVTENRRTPAILQTDRNTDAPIETLDPETLNRKLAIRCGDKFYKSVEQVPLTDLYCYWPLGGSVNVRDVQAAVHVERRAAKQYRRSLTGQLLEFEVPKYPELQSRIGQWRAYGLKSLSYVMVNALVDPVYWPVRDALARLDAGWHSVAINPRVIVAGGKDGKRLVYYQGEFVATADFDTFFPQCDKLTSTLLERAFAGVLKCQNL